MTDDPGWREAAAGWWWVLVPGLAARRVPQAADPLLALRQLFVTFSSALVLMGGVVALLAAAGLEGPGLSPALGLALVVVVAIASLVTPTLVGRPLDCTDEATLAATYRTRFFLRLAVGETSALAGFMAFVLTGAAWLYPVALVFTAVSFARMAPTAQHLAADQDALRERGCALSLTAALRQRLV